jgi:cytidine deaminase
MGHYERALGILQNFALQHAPKKMKYNVRAVIYHGTKPIIQSGNAYHPLFSTHAEENAINKLLKDVNISQRKKYRIYILRFYRDGTLSIAKPCIRCAQLIYKCWDLGIKLRVYFWDGCYFDEFTYDTTPGVYRGSI